MFLCELKQRYVFMIVIRVELDLANRFRGVSLSVEMLIS
jgi:hypothetical protein